MKNRYNTKLDVSLKYGVNAKDKKSKERVDLSMHAVHKDQGADKTVNYTVSLKLPAKVRSLTLKKIQI